jgi:hypothetical protein
MIGDTLVDDTVVDANANVKADATPICIMVFEALIDTDMRIVDLSMDGAVVDYACGCG